MKESPLPSVHNVSCSLSFLSGVADRVRRWHYHSLCLDELGLHKVAEHDLSVAYLAHQHVVEDLLRRLLLFLLRLLIFRLVFVVGLILFILQLSTLQQI